MRSGFHNVVAGLGLWLLAGAAHAELVPVDASPDRYRSVKFVEDTDLTTSSFEISIPGAYRVTLTDYAFPQSFDELAVAITDAAASFFAAQLQAGADAVSILDVTFETPGEYVASVFASLDTGAGAGVGLYSLDVQLTEAIIPLPGALWFLASGLILLGAAGRRPE
jgi:hypothetical protein